MPPRGFKCSKETKEKMSKSKKGKVSNRKGQKDSEITRLNKSNAHLGKQCSEEAKLKLHNIHVGKVLSEETKQKMRKPKSDIHKQKISQSLKGKKFSEQRKNRLKENWSPNPKRNYGKGGIYNGIPFDSSYELKFMQLLDEYKIPYERADNKNFRVKYIFENQEHYYYPDFYLPREGSVVEIKPFYKLTEIGTLTKLNAAKEVYGNNFIIITEKELPELMKGKNNV